MVKRHFAFVSFSCMFCDTSMFTSLGAGNGKSIMRKEKLYLNPALSVSATCTYLVGVIQELKRKKLFPLSDLVILHP